MTLICFLTKKVYLNLVFLRINDHTSFINIKNVPCKWEKFAKIVKTIFKYVSCSCKIFDSLTKKVMIYLGLTYVEIGYWKIIFKLSLFYISFKTAPLLRGRC